jgi:hypothetical protein
LFQKFETNSVSKNRLSEITGGAASATGDTDCTGDAISPDCGDMQAGSSLYKDSHPTSLDSDSCNLSGGAPISLGTKSFYTSFSFAR